MTTQADELFVRGKALFDAKDDKAAVEAFSQAVQLAPQNAIYRAWYARLLARVNESDKAILEANRALELDSKCAMAYFARGNARSDKGDLDGAIADYTEAIRLDPKDAMAYYNRGNTRYNKGDLDGAIADYTEAIRLDPKYAAAYYNRGVARRDKGDLDGAVADYTEAIRLDPKDAAAYHNRGLARYSKGDLDGAITDYTEAIRIDPRYATAYHNRGVACYDKKDLNGAITDYTEVIRIDPKRALAYRNRGDARKNKGDLGGAIADYTEAVRLDSRNAFPRTINSKIPMTINITVDSDAHVDRREKGIFGDVSYGGILFITFSLKDADGYLTVASGKLWIAIEDKSSFWRSYFAGPDRKRMESTLEKAVFKDTIAIFKSDFEDYKASYRTQRIYLKPRGFGEVRCHLWFELEKGELLYALVNSDWNWRSYPPFWHRVQ